MSRRSRAGGETVRAPRRKTAVPKHRTSLKVARRRSSSDATHEAEVARLSSELKATSDVLKVISRSTFDLQMVLDTLIETGARLCEAPRGVILRRDGDAYHGVAFYNASTEVIDFIKRHPIKPGRHTITARVALERRIIHVADLQADTEYRYTLRDVDPIRTELGVPMFRGDDIVGIIILYKFEIQPFTEKQIELVQNFANQAVIAIENARLLTELRQSLEQQTATAEVLGVISSSKFELQPILQTVVDTAARLCRAESAVIFRLDNGVYHFAVGYSLNPTYLEIERQNQILPGHGTLVGRAALTRQVVRIDDAWTDPLYERKQDAEVGVVRSMIGVPLMRNGEPIGVVGLARGHVEPFSDREIELVTTFADQAAIAIENVRLFEAEQQRTRELSESLNGRRRPLRCYRSSPARPASSSRCSRPCSQMRRGCARRATAQCGSEKEIASATLHSMVTCRPHTRSCGETLR